MKCISLSTTTITTSESGVNNAIKSLLGRGFKFNEINISKTWDGIEYIVVGVKKGV